MTAVTSGQVFRLRRTHRASDTGEGHVDVGELGSVREDSDQRGGTTTDAGCPGSWTFDLSCSTCVSTPLSDFTIRLIKTVNIQLAIQLASRRISPFLPRRPVLQRWVRSQGRQAAWHIPVRASGKEGVPGPWVPKRELDRSGAVGPVSRSGCSRSSTADRVGSDRLDGQPNRRTSTTSTVDALPRPLVVPTTVGTRTGRRSSPLRVSRGSTPSVGNWRGRSRRGCGPFVYLYREIITERSAPAGRTVPSYGPTMFCITISTTDVGYVMQRTRLESGGERWRRDPGDGRELPHCVPEDQVES